MENNINITISELLEAGVHFGHRKNYWNPKMAPYLYGVRNGVHIIDLQQTAPMMFNALTALRKIAAKNGRILFVGTKKQASDLTAEAAKRCGQYYVNHRWLGGMLTNWSTVSASIKTLEEYESRLADENIILTKKERISLQRQKEKLEKALGGIRNMGGKPDALFVIDVNNESLAVQEAKKLGITVVAVVDSNCNPDNIDYIIPGNDDARKAIEIYTKYASDAILYGVQDSLSKSGIDISSLDETSAIAMQQQTKKKDFPAKKAKEDKRRPNKDGTAKSEAKKVEKEVAVEASV
jgi:small subunit ribosomal protein S2